MLLSPSEDAVTILQDPTIANDSIAEAPRPGSSVECIERTMTTWDGAELFYRAWLPPVPAQKALLLFHRGHEHSGRFIEIVRELGLEDVAVFAWDQRGHGRSPGERGWAASFSDVVRDIDTFARHISTEHGIPLDNSIVLGHSVAAIAVAAWVHDYAPPIRAMVLATPALRVKLYVPLAVPGLRMLSLAKKKVFISSYVKAGMLTHDAAQAAAYAADPLISRQIAVNILLDLHDTSTRLLADAGAIHTPTLVLTAGSDWVVKNGPPGKFFERLSSPVKKLIHYPGFHHAIFHEADRARPIADVRQFIRERFDSAAPRVSLLKADREGFTKTEHDRLQKPLPFYCPYGLNFRGQKIFLQTMGRLSEGVRIGWETGFDSGASLDHVYQNHPRGITLLGKLIDRFYLSAIGWRGIRQRKVHLQQMLRETIARVRAQGRPVNMLDIAAGPGRYLLEVLRDTKGDDIHAILRDHNKPALEIGREMAGKMGVTSAVFESGDAFDAKSFATIKPPPSIAIVSGLYELFPSNDRVRASLGGLAEALADGGYLIYTNQPWHPQVEMIARVLRNRDGNPWIMRRRTQAEMDELVSAAGFTKLGMLIDRWGIFTVSVARMDPRTNRGRAD
ncbi:MAG: ynbC [Phycisphaerales bacterium]|nr:ynbC [Phycisphaerales bacterium]